MLKLVISDNEGTTTVVPFVRDEISIGRKDGNTIRLTERNISRRHCTLDRVNGSYRVRDHGSYNGVIINGSKIDGESAIKAGDHLQIGDYTLLVEAEAAAVVPVRFRNRCRRRLRRGRAAATSRASPSLRGSRRSPSHRCRRARSRPRVWSC